MGPLRIDRLLSLATDPDCDRIGCAGRCTTATAVVNHSPGQHAADYGPYFLTACSMAGPALARSAGSMTG